MEKEDRLSTFMNKSFKELESKRVNETFNMGKEDENSLKLKEIRTPVIKRLRRRKDNFIPLQDLRDAIKKRQLRSGDLEIQK